MGVEMFCILMLEFFQTFYPDLFVLTSPYFLILLFLASNFDLNQNGEGYDTQGSDAMGVRGTCPSPRAVPEEEACT